MKLCVMQKTGILLSPTDIAKKPIKTIKFGNAILNEKNENIGKTVDMNKTEFPDICFSNIQFVYDFSQIPFGALIIVNGYNVYEFISQKNNLTITVNKFENDAKIECELKLDYKLPDIVEVFTKVVDDSGEIIDKNFTSSKVLTNALNMKKLSKTATRKESLSYDYKKSHTTSVYKCKRKTK